MNKPVLMVSSCLGKIILSVHVCMRLMWGISAFVIAEMNLSNIIWKPEQYVLQCSVYMSSKSTSKPSDCEVISCAQPSSDKPIDFQLDSGLGSGWATTEL